jgi:hypothetical protein
MTIGNSIRASALSASALKSIAAGTLVIAAITGSLVHAQALTPDELNRRMIERRAVEAVIWGMPAVNFDLMLQEFKRIGGKDNQFVYWSRPLDGNNQTLTPNPDSIYFMAFYNTKDVGPVVLEIPPAGDDGSINGNIVTVWQMPLADAGPSGTDKGQGGKYLLLPPGYSDPIPEGYIPLQSDTYGGYGLVRSNLKSHSDADVAKSVAYGKRAKLYPLSQAASPPETVFVDAADTVFDSTIQYDHRFFQSLDRMVQSEPWIPRDRAMIDQLKSIGIEKGKSFNPESGANVMFDEAAKEAGALFTERYDAGLPPFFEGTHWTVPVLPEIAKAMQSGFAEPDSYPVDARGLLYTYAFVGIKNLGAGQYYLINIKDKDGKAYDGSNTYRLTVPPNPPVKQYWSVTVYDRELHTLLRDVKRASRSSQIPEMQKNEDGSINVYFGPEPPAGKESNWVPTKPGREFELMFRLYAPTEALFEKTWTLPDVEKFSVQ